MRTSVVIPVFNGADRLAEAVSSVRAQLGDGDEIVIVDDGSTDGTAELIPSLGGDVVSVRQDHGGVSAARNRGLRLATGDHIAFLDHDDTWAPGRQAALSAALDADPSIDVAMGLVSIVADTPDPASLEDNPRRATVHRPWHLDALLMRRRVFDRVGPFREDIAQTEDVDWFMRAREAGILYGAVDHVTVFYRLHATNLSRDTGGARGSLLTTLKSALDRRRAS